MINNAVVTGRFSVCRKGSNNYLIVKICMPVVGGRVPVPTWCLPYKINNIIMLTSLMMPFAFCSVVCFSR